MKRSVLAAVIVAACAAVVPASGALADPGGYGPVAPTGPAGTPGGFTEVVTTKTVDGSGATVAGAVPGASLSASVPAGAFSVPVQVAVTSPKLADVASALPAVGYSGYTAVAGLGFGVFDTKGNPMEGQFAKPIVITLKGPNLGVPGQKVIQFDGPATASVVDATVGDGSITIHLTHDPNLIVVSPPPGATTDSTSASATGSASGSATTSLTSSQHTLTGATTTHTGKPFTGYSVLGGSFIGAGVGLGALVLMRRRRRATE